jgi:hypothetical protein
MKHALSDLEKLTRSVKLVLLLIIKNTLAIITKFHWCGTSQGRIWERVARVRAFKNTEIENEAQKWISRNTKPSSSLLTWIYILWLGVITKIERHSHCHHDAISQLYPHPNLPLLRPLKSWYGLSYDCRLFRKLSNTLTVTLTPLTRLPSPTFAFEVQLDL